MRAKLVLTIAAAFVVAACDSPEVKRSRGDARGADLGHRAGSIEMHEGSKPYYQTPQLIDRRFAGSGGETTDGNRLLRQ
jgi:hypothetical protein